MNTKQQPLRDSTNMELYVGDTVTLDAIVSDISHESDVKLVVNSGKDNEQTFSVPASVAKKTLTARIGAAPVLRTPVIEIPHPLGGVVPVRADSKEAADFLSGKTNNPKVEGLPNASPQVQILEDGKTEVPVGSPIAP